MKLFNYYTPAVLLTLCLSWPAAAQVVNHTGKNLKKAQADSKTVTVRPVQTPKNQTLNAQVEAAVTRAQAQHFCPCHNAGLSTQELLEAEEELQLIRDKKDSNATFSKYPYLLDPAYRRQQSETCTCPTAKAVSPAAATASAAQEEQELSLREQIDAETELSHIRNTQDPHATFDTYSYLLNPAYRRGNAETRQKVLREFRKNHSSWARKVGI